MPRKRNTTRRPTGAREPDSKLRKITEFFPVTQRTPDTTASAADGANQSLPDRPEPAAAQAAADNEDEPSIVVKIQGAINTAETPSSPSSDHSSSNHSDGSGSNAQSVGTDLTADSNSDKAVDSIYTPAADQPLVWSEVRQPLCAALDPFKAYQGGTYTSQAGVLGLLLDLEARSRDVMGAQTIITTISGGRVANEHGQMTHLKDQETTRYVRSFFQNMQDKLPILVIGGSRHPYWGQRHQTNPIIGAMPYMSNRSQIDAPHRYMVLDWFHVVGIFQEEYRCNNSDPFTTRWIIRLEKTDLNSPSWWYPADRAAGDRFGYALPGQVQAKQANCGQCGVTSKQMFEQAWTCMNRACPVFFNFPAGVRKDLLQYDADFLRERTPYQGSPTDPLMPPLPATEYKDDKYGTEQEFRKGMVCHRCGCCVDRVFWNRWECSSCGYEHAAHMRVYPLSEVAKENDQLREAKRKASKKGKKGGNGWQQLYKDKAIDEVVGKIGGFDTTTYILPDKAGKVIGTITHFRSNAAINAEAGGPDQIFYDMQAEDNLPADEKTMDLKRNPVRHVGLSGEVRTRHYQQNFGAPYKFVVAVQSKPFSEAPDAILRSLARMAWASRAVAAELEGTLDGRERAEACPEGKFEGFNELLALGYMEGDAIGFHDDGEKELGPTVATMSLGSPSIFGVRPKIKAEIRTEKSVTKDTAKMLEFAVLHGDIVVMHGAEIHRQYLHKVDSCGKRRYAKTSRAIIPGSIDDEGERTLALEYGKLPPHAADFEYHGHVDESLGAALED